MGKWETANRREAPRLREYGCVVDRLHSLQLTFLWFIFSRELFRGMAIFIYLRGIEAASKESKTGVTPSRP